MSGLSDETLKQLMNAMTPVDGEDRNNPALAQLRGIGEQYADSYFHAFRALRDGVIDSAFRAAPDRAAGIKQAQLIEKMNAAMKSLKRTLPLMVKLDNSLSPLAEEVSAAKLIGPYLQR